ncbi:MAG: transposase [Ferruginibacter sp.]
MGNITTNYFTRAESWLFITTLIYFLMNGAQIFETAVLVPKWTASPPESFKILADKNGTSLKTFWIVFHSLHELTFILAIVFCWKIDPVRNWLLILFAIHFAVRVWTLTYFAPNIIDFQKIADTASSGKDLISRTSLWQKLNYVRVAMFIAVSIALIPLCIKLMKFRYA